METRRSFAYTMTILSSIFLQTDCFKRIINDQSAIQKTYHITNKVPVTVERHGQIIPQQIDDIQEIAYYFDLENGSAFMVQQGRRTKAANEFEFFGTTHIGSHKYLVQPPNDNYKTHSLIWMQHEKNIYRDYIPAPPSAGKTGRRLKLSITDVDANAKMNLRQYYALMLNEYEKHCISLANTQDLPCKIANHGTMCISDDVTSCAKLKCIIDLIYKSVVERSYEIRLLFAGIHVADNARAATWTETIKNTLVSPVQVNSHDALKKFKLWINDNSIELPGHDHAVLFSRYQFQKSKVSTGHVTGTAYIGGLCGEQKMSIVMDRFKADTTTTAAHELGHNLNALHDGDSNTCSEDDGYIMAAVDHTWINDTVNKKLWKFSNCSLHYFGGFIDKLNRDNFNCMLKRSMSYNDSALHEFGGELRGQIYPPDDQCAARYGTHSYFCRGFFDLNASGICSNMPCSLNGINNGTCWYTLPFSGTSCGNGKVCRQGSCITSHSAPSGLTETCMFGDQPGIVPSFNKSCQALFLEKFHYKCYYDYYRKRCCDTCKQVAQLYLPFRGCDYGDHGQNCDITQCRNYDEHSRSVICCKTCSITTTTTPTTTSTQMTTTTQSSTTTFSTSYKSPSTTTTRSPTTTPTTTPRRKITTKPQRSTSTVNTTSSKIPSATTTGSSTSTPTPFTQLPDSFRPIKPLPQGFTSSSLQLPKGFKPLKPLPKGHVTSPPTKGLPKGFQAIPSTP